MDIVLGLQAVQRHVLRAHTCNSAPAIAGRVLHAAPRRADALPLAPPHGLQQPDACAEEDLKLWHTQVNNCGVDWEGG